MSSETLRVQKNIKEKLEKDYERIDAKNKLYGALDKARCWFFVLWTLYVTPIAVYLFVANAKGRAKIFDAMPLIELFKARAKDFLTLFEWAAFLDTKTIRILVALLLMLSISVVPLLLSVLFVFVGKKFFKGKRSYGLYTHSDSLENARKLSDKARENLENSKKVSMGKKNALICRILLNIYCALYFTFGLSFCFYDKKYTGTVLKLIKKLFTKGVYDDRLLEHFIISAVVLIISALMLFLLFRFSFNFADKKINALYLAGSEAYEETSEWCDVLLFNIDPEKNKSERKREEEQRKTEEKDRESSSSHNWISTASYNTPTESKSLTDDEAWWAISSGMMSADVTGM